MTAVDLERVVREIHDPVVGQAGPGVEAALVHAIELQTGLADLDHEDRPGRMSDLVVTKGAGYHREVRLGLRLLVERDRALAANLPSGAEGDPQRFTGGTHGREVAAALRLGDDQLASEELDWIAGAEEATLDQPVVLDACPPSRPHVRPGHA
jgi:hypothetical protein